MIRYNLICQSDHEFEGWFSSSKDYEDQNASDLIACPICATTTVEKAIMAPAVKTARTSDPQARLAELAGQVRQAIQENCDDVGENFAKEARAIHHGDAPPRGIYGQASPSEAKALTEEGIAVQPLPDVLAPLPKKAIN